MTKDPIEECPCCGEEGPTPHDGHEIKHEEYRQCRNDDCRVRLYTAYPGFFGGPRNRS